MIQNSCFFSETVSDPNTEGGTYRTNDLKCNTELDNPYDDIISQSNILVTYSKDNSTDFY